MTIIGLLSRRRQSTHIFYSGPSTCPWTQMRSDQLARARICVVLWSGVCGEWCVCVAMYWCALRMLRCAAFVVQHPERVTLFLEHRPNQQHHYNQDTHRTCVQVIQPLVRNMRVTQISNLAICCHAPLACGESFRRRNLGPMHRRDPTATPRAELPCAAMAIRVV